MDSKRLILLGLCLMLSSAPVWAQSKTGTTIGQFLLIEPSARVAAMGNAGVTTFDEITAAYFNPGVLGRMESSGAQFTHSEWLADITYRYAGVGIQMGGAGAVMLTVTSLSSGEIDVRTVDQPLGTGERYSVENLALGLAYSRRVTDRFSAGLHVKVLRETIWHSSLSALSLDFGVHYQLPFGSYIGASLSNFGTRGAYDGRDLRIRFDQDPDRFGDNSNLPAALETEEYPLPITFRVGLGMPIDIGSSNRVLLVVDAIQPSDNTQSLSFGGEWTFMNTLSARAGYQNLFQEDSETGLTAGAGLNYELSGYGLRFDYSWGEYGRLGNAQRFTLGVAF
jgi:hypothetical protein